MSLYLGKVGRAVLWSVSRLVVLDRAVNGFSTTAQRILGKRYLPRLTRDLFSVSQAVRGEEGISIRPDGFFQDSRRLGANPLSSCCPRPVLIKLDSYQPEDLARYVRGIRGLVLDFKQLMDKKHQGGFPISSKELTDLFNRVTLRPLLGVVRSPAQLKVIRPHVRDYAKRFGNTQGYFLDVIIPLLKRAGTIEELKGWLLTADALIKDTAPRLGGLKSGNFWFLRGPVLRVLLSRAASQADLRNWHREAMALLENDFWQSGNDVVRYSGLALLPLLEKAPSLDVLRIIKVLILDFAQKFGDPLNYVCYALLPFMEGGRSIEMLEEAKNIVLRYSREIDLPWWSVSEATEVIERVTRRWMLNQESHSRALTDDLKEAFENYPHPLWRALMALTVTCQSVEELKHAGQQLIAIARASRSNHPVN